MTRSKGVRGRTRDLIYQAVVDLATPVTPYEVQVELAAAGHLMSLDTVRHMMHTLRKEPDRRLRIAGYVRSLGTGGPYKATFEPANGKADAVIPKHGRLITGRESARRYRARHAAMLKARRAGAESALARMVRIMADAP